MVAMELLQTEKVFVASLNLINDVSSPRMKGIGRRLT